MTFQKLMDNLQQDYIESLPGKIEEIERNLTEENLQEVQTEFHKLKGTGRTYGIPEITRLGEVVEEIGKKQPHCFVTAVPEALHLLRKIHKRRKNAESAPIESDFRFSRLLAMVT